VNKGSERRKEVRKEGKKKLKERKGRKVKVV
jgi:hypothetical protein